MSKSLAERFGDAPTAQSTSSNTDDESNPKRFLSGCCGEIVCAIAVTQRPNHPTTQLLFPVSDRLINQPLFTGANFSLNADIFARFGIDLQGILHFRPVVADGALSDVDFFGDRLILQAFLER